MRQRFQELFISFLPYWTFLAGLWLGVSIFLFYKRKRIFGLFVLIFGVVFLFWSRQMNGFYRFPVKQMEENFSGGMKVLYANIYKNNADYTWIQALITKENPDLIFFVEFAQHHYDALKTLLKKEYPYTNSTIWSQKFVGNVVFSKVKIDNWADDFPQAAWRYGYFSIKDSSTPLYFYLVHMSSPSSEVNFGMRNRQILSFLNDFVLHSEIHRTRNDKVVLVGDFNTTPRSPWYRRFAEVFSGDFVNVTRSFPILFTWRLIGLPMFWAHIDHIFVNKDVRIRDLHLVTVPWSDHRWLSFIVK